MTEPDTADDPGAQGDPPRLGPRPLSRPAVDEGTAQVFGRPDGVDGGFAVSPGSGPAPRTTLAPPPPAALAGAFGRPATGSDGLQRPLSNGHVPAGDHPFWDADTDRDPWRDPDSQAGRISGWLSAMSFRATVSFFILPLSSRSWCTVIHCFCLASSLGCSLRANSHRCWRA